MSPDEPVGILCVDDDPEILRWERKCLAGRWSVRTADSPEAALGLVDTETPLVVVSDQNMPGMDGLTLLARVRELRPDVVRLLLTGGADLEVAVEAINDNLVFRFLSKPCGVDRFQRMVSDACDYHRLQSAERVLLEQTLRGCVKALVDILAAVSPAAFGRACRAQKSVEAMSSACHRGFDWRVEVAALLSQLGGVILPPQILEKLDEPHRLSPREREMVGRIPGISARLIEGIPRMEDVRAILHALSVRNDGGGMGPEQSAPGFPWEARALRVALAADELQSRGMSAERIAAWLSQRRGSYDPELIDAWLACHAASGGPSATYQVSLHDLREGMRFGADVVTTNGLVIVARGQEVTESILLRLQNFAVRDGIQAPLTIERPENVPAANPAAA